MAYAHGWYCVAFEAEVIAPLHAVSVGERRLLLAQTAAGLRAFDADCPHRGAHLALGHLDGSDVICPYHGYRIRLGRRAGLSVRGYETLVFGGAVYVRLSDRHDHGWTEMTRRLAEEFVVAPGLKIDLHAAMEAVIENAFDRLHFHTIHRLWSMPFELAHDAAGALTVRSRFFVSGGGEVPYTSTTFSPGLTFVWLGGDAPYGVITGPISTGSNRCTARLSYVIPRRSVDEDARRLAELDAYSRQGLRDDDQVWRSVRPEAPVRWSEDDAPIRRFYAFCATFEEPSASAS